MMKNHEPWTMVFYTVVAVVSSLVLLIVGLCAWLVSRGRRK